GDAGWDPRRRSEWAGRAAHAWHPSGERPPRAQLEAPDADGHAPVAAAAPARTLWHRSDVGRLRHPGAASPGRDRPGSRLLAAALPPLRDRLGRGRPGD